MFGIITSVANLLNGAINGYNQRKQAEVDAESKVKITAANSVADWERYNAIASSGSWKDELWTIFFIVYITLHYYPPMLPYMQAGNNQLNQMPLVMQAGISASIAASFGIKAIAGGIKHLKRSK